MTATTTRTRPDADPAHELAAVERDLRRSTGVHEPEVRVTGDSARLYWDTWEPNPATRGRILAGVCTALARSTHWDLVTVHDPMEREGEMISNAVTIRREDEDDD